MKQELKLHLYPLGILFIITSVIWIFSGVKYYEFIFLLLGLVAGSFFLDLDHLVYWLYLKPNLEESRLAQIAFKKRDFLSLIKLLESTHKKHTSLIFHHFFFQAILVVVTVFIISSTNSTFTQSFVLALNVHLLVDEYEDFRHDPEHLQDWLFAREQKQLPQKYLRHYLAAFTLTTLIFFGLLVKTHL